MIYNNFYILQFVGFLFFVQANNEVGNKCNLSPDSFGKCQLLSKCPKASENINKKIYPKVCGFQQNNVIVCCDQKNSTSRIQKQPGDIAKEKCKEYEKYATVKEVSPSLIVGGEVVRRSSEFGHMVALGFESANQTLWLCGGSIISEQFILTAAHCLNSREFGVVKYVKMGTIDLNKIQTGQQIRVFERIPHPNYTSNSHYNDVGLIKLENPIKMGQNVRPACLYLNNEIHIKQGIATGFGKTGFAEETSHRLLKVELNFFSTKNCSESYKAQNNRKLLNGIVSESQICAGSFDEEKDTCQGDSGGPLQIHHSGDDIKYMYDIVGITSFGKACSGNAGVYTKVSYFVDWIESVVWS